MCVLLMKRSRRALRITGGRVLGRTAIAVVAVPSRAMSGMLLKVPASLRITERLRLSGMFQQRIQFFLQKNEMFRYFFKLRRNIRGGSFYGIHTVSFLVDGTPRAPESLLMISAAF